MDTAGRAVLFAGCTVVIALLGMFALGVNFLYGVAISPSLGRAAGHARLADPAARADLDASAPASARPSRARAPSGRRGGRGQRRPADGLGPLAGWVIQRQPVAAGASTVGLGDHAARSPSRAPSLRLGSSDAGNDPTTPTTRTRLRPARRGLRRRLQRPAAGRRDSSPKRRRQGRAQAQIGTALRDDARRGVRRAAAASTRRATSRRSPSIRAPRRRPSDDHELVERLRDDRLPPVERATGATVLRRRRRRPAQSTSPTSLGQQAAAVHRRRRAALGAAAADRVPLAGDPAAGGGDEPAQHRRLARRDRRDLPVGLARRPVRRPARARSSRSSR